MYVHESSLITKPHKREIVSVLNSTLTESRYNSAVIDAKSLVEPSTVLAFLKVTSDFMLDDSSSLMKSSRGEIIWCDNRKHSVQLLQSDVEFM